MNGLRTPMNAGRLIPGRSLWVGFAMALAVMLGVGCSSDGDDVMRSGDVWELSGSLLAWDGDVWLVDDQPLIVPTEVHDGTQLVLGAIVEANGTIDEAGRRVTEKIELSDGPWPDSSLPRTTIEGNTERIDASSWTVNGTEVIVPAGARVHGLGSGSTLSIGDEVTVEGYRLNDDRVLAVDVYLTTEPPAEEDAEATESLDAELAPTILSTPLLDEGAGELVTDSTADEGPQQSDDGISGDSGDGDDQDKDDKHDKEEQTDKDREKEDEKAKEKEREKERDRD